MSAGQGAYGIAVTGLEAEERLFGAAWPDWPTVRIMIEPATPDTNGIRLDEDFAHFPDASGGQVTVDRRAGHASFRGGQGLTPDEIVHPRLGMLGAIYAHWLPGRMAFHAGAFVSGREPRCELPGPPGG